MRRWLPLALVLILLLPLVAESTGTLTLPVTFGSLPAGQQNLTLFDTVFAAIRDYVNQRELTFDVAANRPVAGVHGRTFFATDTNVLSADTGTTWTTIGSTSIQSDALTGLTLSNPAVASGTSVNIAAGAATSDDATITSRVLMILPAAFTKTTGSWAVGSGNGCLDTGVATASTWYHVFVIERLDTSVVDLLCSASATAPTMPTNYTRKRRIGAIFTDGNTAINYFTQRGRQFTWATPSALNVDATNPGTAAVIATATTPNGVVTEAVLNTLLVNGTTSSLLALISDLTTADLAPSRTASPLGNLGSDVSGGPASFSGQVRVWTNTSRQFRFRLSASGGLDIIRINTVGWVDPLQP